MWVKSESNVNPVLQDTESSRVYNYDRRNVEQTERTAEDGSKETIFSYEEKKVLKSEWDNYLTLKELTAQQETTMSAVQDLIMASMASMEE